MVDWLLPWCEADQSERSGLETQLAREIAPGHVLEGVEVRLIARRQDTDDALFALADGRVAEVHLTWRRTRETNSRWPGTAVFESLEQWANESMIPLRRELDAL